MLGSFDSCLSHNCIEIFHQYQNLQEFDLLTSFVFWLGDLLTVNFYLRPQIHIEYICLEPKAHDGVKYHVYVL